MSLFKIFKNSKSFVEKIITKWIFILNHVQFEKDFVTRGVPFVIVYSGGIFTLGKKFKMNNGYAANIIGRQQRCIYVVKGQLTIKDNVGVSSLAIVCHNNVTIGSNVLIGGGTVIYDTDFHSLDYKERTAIPENANNVKTLPVTIEDNVFIGAHSIILKGVTIGKNVIIGAGSVVSKNIPANEIWAGNPAKKIKDIV